MHNHTRRRPTVPMHLLSAEIALIGAMSAEISRSGLDSRFEYEPGQELSVELSVSGHIVSGDTPDGALSFDISGDLDAAKVWSRLERELLALELRFERASA